MKSLINSLKIIFYSLIRIHVLFNYKLKSLINLIRLKNKVKNRKKINVAFFAENVPMWKYSGIFELMKTSDFFSPFAVIAPLIKESHEKKLKDRKDLINFFIEKKYYYVDIYSDEGYVCNRSLKPDIIFYPQPYDGYLPDGYSYKSYPNSLFCYIPYAIRSTGSRWGYDTNLMNIVWKNFYETFS